MAVIGWGKCRILFKNLIGGAWTETPTPVESSTTLTTTKGDKKEAKLEGGANEDVRYNKNTYALEFTIRQAKGKTMPIEHEDGLVSGNYSVAVVPEDPDVPGLMIDKAVVSVEDSFSTDEGGTVKYTFDALQPTSGSQVKTGVVTVTESGGTISNVTIAES